MKPLNSRDPRTIANYDLLGRLGAGGMGDVFLARKGGQDFAIKVIRDSFAEDPDYVARFMREMSILKAVSHPNVISFIESGKADGRLWFASEFAHGPGLDEMVRQTGPLNEKAWNTFSRELLRGLAAIHKNGVVHRDIKPANLIMSTAGLKIIDLGVARSEDETSLTASGVGPGTPAWFSPEQVLGDDVTEASDYFSAGAVLVYAATGRSPWGPPADVTYRNIGTKIFAQPDLGGLTPTQRSLVSVLLERDPASRLRNVQLFIERSSDNIEIAEKTALPQPQSSAASTHSENASAGNRSTSWGGSDRRWHPLMQPAVLTAVSLSLIAAVVALFSWNPLDNEESTNQATVATSLDGQVRLPIGDYVKLGDSGNDGLPCVAKRWWSDIGTSIQLVEVALDRAVAESQLKGYDPAKMTTEIGEKVAMSRALTGGRLGEKIGVWCVYTFQFNDFSPRTSSFYYLVARDNVTGPAFTGEDLQKGTMVWNWSDF